MRVGVTSQLEVSIDRGFVYFILINRWRPHFVVSLYDFRQFMSYLSLHSTAALFNLISFRSRANLLLYYSINFYTIDYCYGSCWFCLFLFRVVSHGLYIGALLSNTYIYIQLRSPELCLVTHPRGVISIVDAADGRSVVNEMLYSYCIALYSR